LEDQECGGKSNDVEDLGGGTDWKARTIDQDG